VAPVSLGALVVERLAGARRAEVAAIAELDSIAAHQLAEARRAWPELELADASYARALGDKLADRAGEPAERVLRTMPAADLFLATACAAGDAAAIALFRAQLAPALRQALGKLAIPAAAIDETEQRVWIMLLVGDTAQIRQYSGRGRLRSWVRSIAVRTARRLAGAAHAQGGERELSELPAAVRDPELELLRARYGAQVKAALAHAMAELTPRQRNVLRQYHLDGLTIDRLAALYQINRATAARWVAGARLALVAAMRARLVAELAIDTREVDSIIRMVRSELSISVRELG